MCSGFRYVNALGGYLNCYKQIRCYLRYREAESTVKQARSEIFLGSVRYDPWSVPRWRVPIRWIYSMVEIAIDAADS